MGILAFSLALWLSLVQAETIGVLAWFLSRL